MRNSLLATFAAATFIALLSGSGAALADTAYDRCVNESDGSNVVWASCGAEFVEREDTKLNRVWKALFADTEGQTKKDLLAEQRAWVKYKELACAFYANGDWGREGQVLSYPACEAKVIADRTAVLESYREAIAPN